LLSALPCGLLFVVWGFHTTIGAFAAIEKTLMSRRIALIVGVSQYDKIRTGLDSLAAPVNDAQAVYEVLAKYGGFGMFLCYI
jgi:hypothetical protein